jgi:hypothetical protein
MLKMIESFIFPNDVGLMESWKILKKLYESHNIAKAFYLNNNQ